MTYYEVISEHELDPTTNMNANTVNGAFTYNDYPSAHEKAEELWARAGARSVIVYALEDGEAFNLWENGHGVRLPEPAPPSSPFTPTPRSRLSPLADPAPPSERALTLSR
jgi:hypothetical protein